MHVTVPKQPVGFFRLGGKSRYDALCSSAQRRFSRKAFILNAAQKLAKSVRRAVGARRRRLCSRHQVRREDVE
jgi:hypothetical protein